MNENLEVFVKGGDYTLPYKKLRKRPLRFIPVAVTPIKYSDLFSAISAQNMKNDGNEKFEHSMGSYLGVKGAYTFTSFMRAIYACLSSLKRTDEKNEIILPRYSCPSFAHAIIAADLKIRYCDSNPRTLSIDLESLENTDLKNVLGLICVNYFGLSNPMDQISKFCKRSDVCLIEDIGYSLGTEYNGKKLGSYGDFSVLNFQEGKSIPIGGGMVATNNTDLMDDLIRDKRKKEKPRISISVGYKFFSNPHAYYLFMKTSNLFGENMRKKFSMEDTIRNTANEYDFTFDKKMALNSISDFQGELGCSLLSKIDKHIEIREKNAQILEKGLINSEDINMIQKEKGVDNIHYIRYPIMISKGLRNKILSELLNSGIEASSMYSDHGIDIDSVRFPGAKEVSNKILTLPCHPNMNEMDLARIIDIILGKSS